MSIYKKRLPKPDPLVLLAISVGIAFVITVI